MRRGELCALRLSDIDFERELIVVSRSLVDLSHRPLTEGPTKNRRLRRIAVDRVALDVVNEQRTMVEKRAAALGATLDPNPYLFTDAPDASAPWRPMMVTRYFGRLCRRLGMAQYSWRGGSRSPVGGGTVGPHLKTENGG